MLGSKCAGVARCADKHNVVLAIALVFRHLSYIASTGTSNAEWVRVIQNELNTRRDDNGNELMRSKNPRNLWCKPVEIFRLEGSSGSLCIAYTEVCLGDARRVVSS